MRATRVPRTIQNTTAIVLPIGLAIFAWMWLTRPVKDLTAKDANARIFASNGRKRFEAKV
jgi:hypothetical protein